MKILACAFSGNAKLNYTEHATQLSGSLKFSEVGGPLLFSK